MKRVAIAAIAATCTIAFTQIASAADMPAKAPIVAPVAPVTWTGFYAGGKWATVGVKQTPIKIPTLQ